jgi:predicted glycosyltransferase involved in capsule biosynthesis
MGQILMEYMKIKYTRTQQTNINAFLTQVVWYVCLCVPELLGTNISNRTASNLKLEIYIKEDLLTTLRKVNYFAPSNYIYTPPSSVCIYINPNLIYDKSNMHKL